MDTVKTALRRADAGGGGVDAGAPACPPASTLALWAVPAAALAVVLWRAGRAPRRHGRAAAARSPDVRPGDAMDCC